MGKKGRHWTSTRQESNPMVNLGTWEVELAEEARIEEGVRTRVQVV